MSDLPSYPDEAAAREAAQTPPGGDVAYSGWWRRAAALVIDGLVVTIVPGIAIGIGLALTAVSDVVGAIVLVLGIAGLLVFPIAYNIYFVGKEPGQTPGKRALGIRVRHAEQDRAIGYGPATGRYLITVAFGFFTIPLILDYLWPLWDQRNQSLHDKVATSVVVRA